MSNESRPTNYSLDNGYRVYWDEESATQAGQELKVLADAVTGGGWEVRTNQYDGYHLHLEHDFLKMELTPTADGYMLCPVYELDQHNTSIESKDLALAIKAMQLTMAHLINPRLPQ